MRTTTTLLARLALAFGVSGTLATFAFASQQPAVVVQDDDITIRGCVGRAPTVTEKFTGDPVLVWTRSDIMLSSALAVSAGQTAPLAERVFYWLEDDDDLSKHVGRLVEVKGDLGDFKQGEVEIDRDGDYTKIEMKIGGKTEKATVPTAWLGAQTREGEFDIATRKIDVDNVNVLGPCPGR
jgi:hypothetical protein